MDSHLKHREIKPALPQVSRRKGWLWLLAAPEDGISCLSIGWRASADGVSVLKTPIIGRFGNAGSIQTGDCQNKVSRFEKAERNVMSKCVVASSGKTLSIASRHSMSPYFIIEALDD